MGRGLYREEGPGGSLATPGGSGQVAISLRRRNFSTTLGGNQGGAQAEQSPADTADGSLGWHRGLPVTPPRHPRLPGVTQPGLGLPPSPGLSGGSPPPAGESAPAHAPDRTGTP